MQLPRTALMKLHMYLRAKYSNTPFNLRNVFTDDQLYDIFEFGCWLGASEWTFDPYLHELFVFEGIVKEMLGIPEDEE